MNLLWQFEGGYPHEFPLEALYSAASSNLRQPVRIDCEEALGLFARQCALDVIHLWDAPGVVHQYLETGDESLRSTANAIALNCTREEARDAVKSAARNAAWYAAWDGPSDEASETDGVWDAAWAAASDERDAVSAYASGGKPDDVSYRVGRSVRFKQYQRLTTLLAAHICPVPEDLTARLEEHRRLQYQQPELLPLYLGTWWDMGFEGLNLIEI